MTGFLKRLQEASGPSVSVTNSLEGATVWLDGVQAVFLKYHTKELLCSFKTGDTPDLPFDSKLTSDQLNTVQTPVSIDSQQFDEWCLVRDGGLEEFRAFDKDTPLPILEIASYSATNGIVMEFSDDRGFARELLSKGINVKGESNGARSILIGIQEENLKVDYLPLLQDIMKPVVIYLGGYSNRELLDICIEQHPENFAGFVDDAIGNSATGGSYEESDAALKREPGDLFNGCNARRPNVILTADQCDSFEVSIKDLLARGMKTNKPLGLAC